MQVQEENQMHFYSQYDDFIDLVICPEAFLQKSLSFPSSHQHSMFFNEDQFQHSSLLVQKVMPSTSDAEPMETVQTSRAKKNDQNDDMGSEKFELVSQSQSQYSYENFALKPKEKNSNSIKKIGRIILDHISEFSKTQMNNTSLNEMLSLLSYSKKGKIVQQYKKRDRFNTYHMARLLTSENPRLSSFNLRTTRKLLVKHLRKVVLSSDQIKLSSKLVYMNTMKCSALRCLNSKLAVRLQMSTQPK